MNLETPSGRSGSALRIVERRSTSWSWSNRLARCRLARLPGRVLKNLVLRLTALHARIESPQVYSLSIYARKMPIITNLDKREETLARVHTALRKRRIEAKLCRRWTEETFALENGSPIDDFWKPLKRNYFWWKILVYYAERGFLVALIKIEDGTAVASSFQTIIASFFAIGLSTLACIILRPYLKDKENW